jgi:fibronectin type III domain protein
VSALNGGEGPRSNEASATTPPVPSVPRNVATTGGADRITLSWQAPLDDGGSAVIGYKVYRGSSAGSETLFATLGNVTSFIDTPLATGVMFFYRVSARNANGEGPLSASVFGRTTTPPSAPLNAAATPSAGRIDVTWSAPSSNGGSAISSYRIYRGADAASLSFRGTATGLAFADPSLPAGTTFSYAVSAVNVTGEGPLSAVVSATTPVPPAAPANVLAQPGSGVGQIRITWSSPPSTGGSPVTKYQVYRADVLIATVNAPSLTFTDSGRQPLQSYTYRVSASNAVGEGAKSAESCTKPFPWHAALDCLF